MIKTQGLIVIFLIMLMQTMPIQVYGEGLSGEREKGWHFWNEKKEAEVTDKLSEDKKKPVTGKHVMSERAKRNKQLKEDFKEALSLAIFDPTTQNVMRAQILQAIIMQRSKEFMNVWSKTSLQLGNMLNNRNNPNPLSEAVARQEQAVQNRARLTELAKTGFLVLQAREGCGFAKAFAPIVRDFAGSYGFTLVAATPDGADFEGISGVVDGGKLDGLNPKRETPVLYLVTSSGNEVFVISRGIYSIPQIEQNINLMMGWDQ